MSDVLTPDDRRRNMAAIRAASTEPELKLRRALWHLGFRYRLNDKRLPGTPDIVLPRFRSVIFVHGCFWHGHKNCKYYTVPQTNTDFWKAKISRNQERDQEVWRQLEAKGWYVIIVWECQLKKALMDRTISRVTAEINSNGHLYQKILEERKSGLLSYKQERKALREEKLALSAELKEKFSRW